MFATSGYFRGVPCPFFASGLCERPYCHFRHVKPDDRDAEGNSLPKVSENVSHPLPGNSSLLTMVGSAIKQVQREIESLPGGNVASPVIYRPSPIVRPGAATMAVAKPLVAARRVTIPQYNPTPIKLLKKQASNRPSPKDDRSMKYDPATNFSAHLASGPSPLKRRSGEGSDKSPKKAKLQESEDEIEAKFSDDEEGGGQLAPEVDSKEEENNELSPVEGNKLNETVNKANTTVALNFTKGPDDNKSKGEKGVKDNKIVKQDNGSDKNIFDLLDNAKITGKKSPKPKVSTEGSDKENGDSHSKNCVSKDIDQREMIICDSKLKDKGSFPNVSIKKESEDTPSSKLNLTESDKGTGEMSDSSSKLSKKHKNKSGDKLPSDVKTSKKDSKERSSHGKSEHSKLKKHKEHSDEGRKSHTDEKSSHKKHKSSKSEKSHHGKRSSSTGTLSEHRKDASSRSDKVTNERDSVTSSEKSVNNKVKVKTERSASKDSSGNPHKRRSSDSVRGGEGKQRTSSTEEGSSHKSSHKGTNSLKLSKSHQSSSKACSKSSKSHKRTDKTSDKSRKSISERRLSNGKKISASDLFGSENEDSDCELVMMSPPPDHSNPVASDVIRLSSDSDSENDGDFLPVEDKADSADEDGVSEKKSTVVDNGSLSSVSKKRGVENHSFEDLSAPVKKRVAHQGAMQSGLLRKKVAPSKPTVARPSPTQVMANRLKEIQQQAREAKERLMARRNSSVPTSPPGRTRVAHLPKPASPVKSPEQSPTPCGTQDKVTSSKRLAHTPSQAVLKRPTVPPDSESKVPNAVRQRYLNAFIDTCLKIYGNEQDAFDRALFEERVAAERSSSKQVYLNVAVNVVKKLRSESGSCGVSKRASGLRVQSHSATIAGPGAANTSIQKSKSPKTKVQFSSSELYERLCSYILTVDQLVENGFPRPKLGEPGKTVISLPEGRKPKLSNIPLERICCRCGKQFAITSEGDYVNMDECMYHWGRSFKRRVNGAIENRYTCCESVAGTMGCQVCMGHVHEQNKYENLSGYVETSPGTPPPDGNYGVYALDCEMVYTTAGLELARVTVVNHQLEPVYEQLVQPSKLVIDHNTRFSGLTADTLKGVTVTIKDVQAHLHHLFSEDTILVGHSLESDLVALKMIHSTVVDTSVVFPHRLGPPYKRALKNLSGELLQKIIQEDEGGHDSLEDASVAMELMLYKLRQDAKLRRS